MSRKKKVAREPWIKRGTGTEWKCAWQETGRTIVTRGIRDDPHYHVLAEFRPLKVCDDLALWLNEGVRPEWADKLDPTSDKTICRGKEIGVNIGAVGPMSPPHYKNMDMDKEMYREALMRGLLECPSGEVPNTDVLWD